MMFVEFLLPVPADVLGLGCLRVVAGSRHRPNLLVEKENGGPIFF